MSLDSVPDALDGCSLADLRSLAEAARELRHCQRVMAKSGETPFSLLGTGPDELVRWLHYPEGDVYDPEFHAQYYFHVHPLSPPGVDEYGHFHTFLRPFGMPEGVQPVPFANEPAPEDPNDALSHLIAVALDRSGAPVRLFTTNRWVTGETWYPAADVERMLDHFSVDLARPSWLLNRWLSALLRLFKPQIGALLQARDATIAAFGAAGDLAAVLDDRSLEITSTRRIDVAEQVALIDRHLRRRPARLDRSGPDQAGTSTL